MENGKYNACYGEEKEIEENGRTILREEGEAKKAEEDGETGKEGGLGRGGEGGGD